MSINEKQRQIIIAGLVVATLMGLFPPWTATFKAKNIYSEKPAEYGLIFAPPAKGEKSFAHGLYLDITRLSIQWVVVLLVTGLGVILTAKRNNE